MVINSWWRMLLVLALGLVTPQAQAAATHARLVLAAETARAGETVLAGVHLQMDPGWHIYWRNPGESGIATKIDWTLPAGITAGEIQWPVPERLVAEGLTTYVHHDETVLLVPLTLAANLPNGPVTLKAKVSWLECEKQCVPGRTEVEATLTIGSENKAAAEAGLLETWKKKLAAPATTAAAVARWAKAAEGDKRDIIFEWNVTGAAKEPDFFAYPDPNLTVKPAVEVVMTPLGSGKVQIRKTIEKSEGGWPTKISGLLVSKGGSESFSALDASLPIAELSAVNSQTTPVEPVKTVSKAGSEVARSPAPSLIAMLGLAFLGGLVLNIMPCVLPVIALKILGFVQQSKDSPGKVLRLGLIYGAGVLVSFLVLALLVIGVQKAGHAASWGMQFQNPQFLVAMTTLVTLVALNLFGVFEVLLSGRAMGAAGELAAKEGGAGAFFNGVLATALATPCTAPFLAPALGFAFAQPPSIIILMFLTVGLGLASPYVILSWQPAWLKFLPRPGAWMEKFKIAMGFPMLATALWMFSLAAPHFGRSGALWLGMFLITLSLAMWVFGEFVQRGSKRTGLAVVIALSLAGIGYGYALERELHWRSPAKSVASAGVIKESPEGIEWQPWSPEAVEKARTEGHAVLVDFTADWCLTCQVNKKTSIEIPSVRAKLKETKAVAFLGDHTQVDDRITQELKRHDRAGVPLVLVYPRDPKAPAIVLPEVLTPSIVLEALEKAK